IARSYSINGRRSRPNKTILAWLSHCYIYRLGAHIFMREIEKCPCATYIHHPEIRRVKSMTKLDSHKSQPKTAFFWYQK
ncbi:hypothetical protein TSAR_006901, partial [Trichomalopsis sarcophagae]